MKKEKDPTFMCCFFPSFLAVEHQSLSQKKKKVQKKYKKRTRKTNKAWQKEFQKRFTHQNN